MELVKGDLLEADLDYYCHQVNCQGRMGSGIAKSIKERWPIVYDRYIEMYSYALEKSNSNSSPYNPAYYLLGKVDAIHIGEHKRVINMFAQEYYGYDGKRYTSYDAFWSCLYEIRGIVPKGSKIGFPKGIGCGLGGANWQVIETMICEMLDDDYKVYIYELEK